MSKLGVYFSSCYMIVGGQKCELSTANKLPHTYPFAHTRTKLRDKSNHEQNILRYMAYTRVIPTHSLHKWDMWHQLTCFLGLFKSGTVLKTKSSSQFHILVPWRFLEVFLKTKHSSLYTPQMALSNHSMVYQSLPRHSVLPSFVSPTSKMVYVQLQVGINKIAYLYYICCKVKQRIQGEKCHTLRSRCACVWKKVD